MAHTLVTCKVQVVQDSTAWSCGATRLVKIEFTHNIVREAHPSTNKAGSITTSARSPQATLSTTYLICSHAVAMAVMRSKSVLGLHRNLASKYCPKRVLRLAA